MIPNSCCCLESLASVEVEKVAILEGRRENCVLLKLFSDSGVGTESTI